MCGICGIAFSDRSARIGVDEFARMRDEITHRGPDDAGEYVAPGIALGTRRLAILDLSPRGHMPMSTADGRYWITYNGEVYNFRELRQALAADGARFASEGDTEVVLQLYAREGPEMLRRLNGMFAFAIWDAQERRLFVARDRLGIKPLYYVERGGDLLFGSEAKALFAAGVAPELDESVLPEILCFRFAAGPRSPYAGVRKLPPGHYLTWKEGSVRIQRWWSLADRAQELRGAREADPESWFRETFDDSVLKRTISDVPVGVLLSGGLDSSSVAASLGLQGQKGLASFTVGFVEQGYDESPLAREVATRHGLEFHALTLNGADMAALLPEASYLNDEPLVHGNDVHLLALSRYAKPRVTVLLSGEGGDETLGGYVRYQPLRRPSLLRLLARSGSPRRPGRLAKLRRMAALGAPERWVLYNASDVLPEALREIGVEIDEGSFEYRRAVLREAQRAYPDDLARQAMYSDQHTFLCSILDRNDRMTMGASIECRVPFLDYRLVERLAAMPSSTLLRGLKAKRLLRRALGDRLPESIRRHRKWGFGVPWSRYLREVPELSRAVRELPEREPIRSGRFDRRGVGELIRRFEAGDTSRDLLIRQLLLLAVWHEAALEGGRSRRASAALA